MYRGSLHSILFFTIKKDAEGVCIHHDETGRIRMFFICSCIVLLCSIFTVNVAAAAVMASMEGVFRFESGTRYKVQKICLFLLLKKKQQPCAHSKLILLFF